MHTRAYHRARSQNKHDIFRETETEILEKTNLKQRRGVQDKGTRQKENKSDAGNGIAQMKLRG